MKMKVSASEAEKLLRGIPHETCRSGSARHWSVLQTGHVTSQSICWLACWAWTGMGSETARIESERVFNAILPVSFSTFKSRVPHAVARNNRYRPTYGGPVLDDLSVVTQGTSKA